MKHEQETKKSANFREDTGLNARYHWAELSDLCGKVAVEKYDPAKHRADDYDWIEAGRPILYNELIREGNLIGAVDMGEGRDLFWDGRQWHTSKYGIFTEEWVFVTDYHGFPQGALFKRVRQNPVKKG